MKKSLTIFVVAALFITSLACNINSFALGLRLPTAMVVYPSTTPEPLKSPTATPTRATPTPFSSFPINSPDFVEKPFVPGDLIYDEDFSSNKGYWSLNASPDYSDAISIEHGEMVFKMKTPNIINSSIFFYKGKGSKDVMVSVDARFDLFDPNGHSGVGIICRYLSPQDYYSFSYNKGGLFAIHKIEKGKDTLLIPFDYSNNTPKSQIMTLQAACIGDRLSFWANGRLLGEVMDETFSNGDVGLSGLTDDHPGLTAAFDNFKLYAPSEPISTPTYVPTQSTPIAAKEKPFPAGTFFKQDDFNIDNGTWTAIFSGDLETTQFKDGELTFNIKTSNQTYFSLFHTNDNLSDAIMSVDSKADQSIVDGDFALICRYEDNKNFYQMDFTKNGYFMINKTYGGENTTLLSSQYTFEIPKGAPMMIQAACIGNKLSIGANGILFGEVVDDALTTGQIGLGAGTFNIPEINVAFDHFRVYKP